MKQQSLSMVGYFDKGKKTRREQFLAEMEQVVPWRRLYAVIEPHYPKGSPKGGRPALPLERMFRIYCLQQWYNLSDPGAEEALYDSLAMRRFAGVVGDDDVIPDETSILKFRRLLEEQRLTERLLREVNVHLGERGCFVGKGTIVDATIIHAPPSTKNRERARDPEMSSVRKGEQWHFGMKAHIGVDVEGGLVHTLVTTTAKESDQNVLPQLLHGHEDEVLGDRGYGSQADRALAAAAGIELRTAHRKPRGQELTVQQELENKVIASLRAIVEFPFHVIKRLWGHAKVRYRGLFKNTVQLYALFALSNLFLARSRR